MLLFSALCPSQTGGKEEGRGNRLGVGSQSQASPHAAWQPKWTAWMAGLRLLLSQGIGKPQKQSALTAQNHPHEGRRSRQLPSAQVAGSARPGPAGSEGRVAFCKNISRPRNDT